MNRRALVTLTVAAALALTPMASAEQLGKLGGVLKRANQMRDIQMDDAEEAQLGADPEQALLGAQWPIDGVPLRSTDGAEQDGIGGTRPGQRFPGQRFAVHIDRRTAQQSLAQLDAEAEAPIRDAQHLDRLRDHFRTDTITRKNQYFHCITSVF